MTYLKAKICYSSQLLHIFLMCLEDSSESVIFPTENTNNPLIVGFLRNLINPTHTRLVICILQIGLQQFGWLFLNLEDL